MDKRNVNCVVLKTPWVLYIFLGEILYRVGCAFEINTEIYCLYCFFCSLFINTHTFEVIHSLVKPINIKFVMSSKLIIAMRNDSPPQIGDVYTDVTSFARFVFDLRETIIMHDKHHGPIFQFQLFSIEDQYKAEIWCDKMVKNKNIVQQVQLSPQQVARDIFISSHLSKSSNLIYILFEQQQHIKEQTDRIIMCHTDINEETIMHVLQMNQIYKCRMFDTKLGAQQSTSLWS